MKRILLVCSLIFAFTIFNFSTARAQVKFGHINSAELLAAMPDMAAAETQLKNYSEKLDAQYKEKLSTFETKYKSLMERAQKGEITPNDQAAEEKKLQEMQTEIQTFEGTAQADITKKRQELIEPIVSRAQKAIKDVATENNIAYVFDLSTGSILHYPDGDNIMALVKTKLGM